MTLRVSLLAIMASFASAAFFAPMRTKPSLVLQASSIGINPGSPFLGKDEIDRSAFCADHFGACTVEEMEELRKSECNIPFA